MTKKRKTSRKKKDSVRKMSRATGKSDPFSGRFYYDSRGKTIGWGPYSVACVADYDAAKTEVVKLLVESKILTDRIEVLKEKERKSPQIPPLGFRTYRIGNRALVVNTLSQMTYSTSADTAR